MSILTASDLARQRHVGITLPGAYGRVLGDVAPNFTALVWGPKGGGKSTFALGLADVWARHVAPVLYVSAEEAHGAPFADRIRRLGAASDDLHISTYDAGDGLAGILRDLRSTGAGLVVIDSISWIDPQSASFGEFARDLQDAGVALVYIAHARKGGGDYLGSTRVGHAVDAVFRVADGEAATEKNRYAPLSSAPVPFTRERGNPAGCACRQCAGCGGVVRSNPPHSAACAYASKHKACSCSCRGRMHGSGLTRTVGRVKTAGKQTGAGRAAMAGMTSGGTKRVKPGAVPVRRSNPSPVRDTVVYFDGEETTIGAILDANAGGGLTRAELKRLTDLAPGESLYLGGGAGADFLVERPARGARANPVPTPFGVPFEQLAKTHTIKGVAKLNKLVGFESPALLWFAVDGDRMGEDEGIRALDRAERAQMAFAWKSRSRAGGGDTRVKQGVLTVAVFTESSDPDLFDGGDGRAPTWLDPWSREARVYEFPGRDFAAALDAFLRAFGRLRVVVYDQVHAKLVLGAKEYRRQERAAQPKTAARPKVPRKPRVSAPRPKPAATRATAPKRTPAPKKSATPKPPRVSKPAPSSQASGVGDLAAFDSGMASLESILAKAIA